MLRKGVKLGRHFGKKRCGRQPKNTLPNIIRNNGAVAVGTQKLVGISGKTSITIYEFLSSDSNRGTGRQRIAKRNETKGGGTGTVERGPG